MRKYAALEVLESWRVPAQASREALRKAAHRVAFDYEPRPGYIYVRSRMISSRTNDNHDTFPAPEIEAGYKTFLGKPVFVNHHNANHRRARGVIVAVALHRDKNPDGTADVWVEGLHEIDALRFPKLAQAILAGRVNRTSMGVDVEWSRCSACGNKATSPAEYCHHLPALKGKKIRKRNPATGKVEERLIHEICAGLSFFENSLLVEEPADPTAYFLGKPDDRGLGKAASKRGAVQGWAGQEAADADNLYHLGGCHHSACGRHLERRTAARHTAVDIIEDRLHHPGDPAAEPVRYVAEGARAYNAKVGLDDPHSESYSHIETNPGRIRRLARAYDSMPMNDPGAHHAFTEMARQVNHQYDHLTGTMGVHVEPVDHDPYKNHLEMMHDLTANKRLRVLSTATTGPHGFFDDDTNDKFRAVHDAFGHAATGRSFDRHGEEAAWLAHSRMFHGDARHAMTSETRGQNSMLIATGRFAPQKTALLPHEFMQSEAAAKKQGGDHPFFQDHPVSAANVVAAYHDTTDDEKALGDRWYSDAHHVAKSIAGGDAAKGAGLLSAYSPQTAWPVNMFNASRAAQGDPPGPGSGAMGQQQKSAMRILGGEHHSQVLKAPKTSAFAHLIEHGGDTHEDEKNGTHKVVVDRHALSVAVGHRMSKEDATKAPLGQSQHYEHVAQAYRDAAGILSDATGRKISPHQVQAATWLRQIRKNQEEDTSGKGGGGLGAGRGRVQMQNNSKTRWEQHHKQHHNAPHHIDPENMHYRGKRVQAYGETRVPPDVDTLRMEECPVCGEHDVWSGSRCPVCGFIVPPSLFRDPDVTKAQQVRDQLDQQGEVVTNPGQPGDPSTGQIGSGEDADDQLMHPDQVAPDGTPAVQGQNGPEPGAPSGLPPLAQPAEGDPGAGAEEQAEGEAEQEQGEEDEQVGAGEEAEGQELAQEGEEDQLAPAPDLMCPACGAAFATDMAAQPGTPCPACRQGSLQPAGGPPEGTEGDPEVEDDEDEDEEMAGSKTAAALARAQAQRIAVLTAENEVLTEQLRFLASAAGVDGYMAQIRQQVMTRHADVLNPASPVPDPPEAPATESTEQALQPLANDDPSRPGTTPGANGGVPARQTTTAITPGVEDQTPPATNLIDVTAPVTGTNPSQDGGVPLEQRRIETDVRIDPDPLKAHGPGIGGQGDNGSAFPWMLDAQQPKTGQGQRAAALNSGSPLDPPVVGEAAAAQRTFASIRLAKLRIATGSVQGDELSVAERIERDASMPTALIEHEIGILSRMPAYQQPQQRPMQRAAARAVPSLASVGATASYAPAVYAPDNDASDIFL